MPNVKYIPRINCIICGENHLEFIGPIEDLDSFLGTFNLLQCPQCKMYYTSPYPSPETLPNLYSDKTTRNFDPHNSKFFENLKDLLAKREIKKIVRHLPPSENTLTASSVITDQSKNESITIADFGCGNGRYARCFKEVLPNAEIDAVDFSSTPPPNCSLPYQTTSNFYADKKTYHLIFMRHVLEHVDHPQEFLKKLLRKLKSNGIIYLEVPNIHNGLRILFDRYLPSYFPPYHLLHYSPENLTYLLNSMRLEFSIGQTEMPIMSNLIANMLHQKLNNLHRLLGVFLHPLQLLLCMRQHTVLTAYIKSPKK